jgi:hypothetical protein
MRLEGLGKLKNSVDLVGNLTRDLPACSIVPQPTTLPRAPLKDLTTLITAGEDRNLCNSKIWNF